MSLDLQDNDTGVELNQPISISNLLKGGTIFEINSDFDNNPSNGLFDDFNFGSDDDDDENNDLNDREITISPWERSFNELRQQMIKVNDDIYKKIINEGNPTSGTVPERSRVTIEYDAYWEMDSYPFDSSNLRGKPHIFYCGQNEVLPGLEMAVRTMLKGEESQFVISYRLLFREMGCPPRVKPKADGLFIIKLKNFIECGNANAIEQINDEDRNKFSIIIDKIKDVHLKGLDLYKNGNLQGACKLFHKAITALEFCRLNNENEQNEQEKFLIKLYTNLAVCYNRLQKPTKTCLMCNAIRKISNINDNCKALFQEGRALLMIGEFIRAKQRLMQAQKLEPYNNEINKELKLLAKKYEEYNKNEKSIWQKAMRVKTNVTTNDDDDDNNKRSAEDQKFRNEIKNMLRSFKESTINDTSNTTNKKLILPDGLAPHEVNTFTELAKEFDLKLQLNPDCNQKRYIITKN